MGDDTVHAMQQIVDGIWRWAARHPEWHPRTPFGAEVASYALRGDRETLLVDPLAPDGDVEALIAALAPALTTQVRILVTIPYHVRSSEPLWQRLRDVHETTIHGHAAVAKRLRDTSGFRAIRGGVALDGGILPITIGNPRRYETPLFVPGHRALVLGDAIVETGGRLRVWIQQPLTPSRRAWYATRLLPSFAPLLEVDAERVLVTHGQPIVSGGRAALAAALDGDPWYHRPS
jgi:glyoxylase-like metal-dependent hydrolase (beta-lactamase superfamily II)